MEQSPKRSKTMGLARERKCRRDGFDIVIGVDEAGRGPLAGPVTAAAVAIIDATAKDTAFSWLVSNVNDSKKLSAAKREKIRGLLTRHPSFAWGFARVEAATIDKINILEASKRAMARAVNRLLGKLPKASRRRVFCLVDGNFALPPARAQQSIIGGDSKVFSIAAASVIAKAGRDRIMERLDKNYPAWGFARHKGYPTKSHLAALVSLGPTRAHRRSFTPCALARKKAIIYKIK